MDPIVAPLRKKLLDFQAQRNAILKRLAADQASLTDLNGAILGIEAVLKIEGALESPTPTQAQLPVGNGSNPPGAPTKLPDILKLVLSDGQPRRLRDLIAHAQNIGFDFGEKQPEKAVNFTLMGIANGKKIQRIGADVWQQVG